jgi:hypothetical protein
MGKNGMRKTMIQRLAIGRVLMLKQDCEALGLPWDEQMIDPTTLQVDEDRYLAGFRAIVDLVGIFDRRRRPKGTHSFFELPDLRDYPPRRRSQELFELATAVHRSASLVRRTGRDGSRIGLTNHFLPKR